MLAGSWRINFIKSGNASLECSCSCTQADCMSKHSCLCLLSLPGLPFLQLTLGEKYKDIGSTLVVNEICSHFISSKLKTASHMKELKSSCLLFRALPVR